MRVAWVHRVIAGSQQGGGLGHAYRSPAPARRSRRTHRPARWSVATADQMSEGCVAWPPTSCHRAGRSDVH